MQPSAVDDSAITQRLITETKTVQTNRPIFCDSSASGETFVTATLFVHQWSARLLSYWCVWWRLDVLKTCHKIVNFCTQVNENITHL